MKDVTVALKDLTSRLGWQHVRQLENPNNWGLRGASLGSYSNLGRLHSLFRPLSEGKGGPRKLPEEGPLLCPAAGMLGIYTVRGHLIGSLAGREGMALRLQPARCCSSAAPRPHPGPATAPHRPPHRPRLGGRRLKPCTWGWCACLCPAGLRLSGTFLSV